MNFTSYYILLAALEEGQENLCKLPDKVSNFVGREEELKKCSKILDLESNNKFLVITGGPGFGKSSLAVRVGYEMYDKGFSYVIWIKMRDITKNPINPSIEEIAKSILKKFSIYPTQMQSNMEDYLRQKLEIIVKNSKSALLIFDNADNLIDPKRDESRQSSAYERLWELIKDLQGNSIRCMFTSRVFESPLRSRDHELKLKHLSVAESHCFVRKELQDLSFQDSDALIQDFVAIGHGLPYALELMCSEVLTMDDDKEMIEGYVKRLKEGPLKALNDKSRMTDLFELSYKRLTPDERCVFTSLAVFPSSFSYSYLSKVLKNLGGNLMPTVLNKLKKHSLVGFDSGLYMIHPFLREFLQEKHRYNDSYKKYERAYYRAYTNELFYLAKESLKKDRFSDCLQEFHSEQQNFLHVMEEISKGWTSSPYHLQQLVKEELLKLNTPDYIFVVLFLCHEVYDRYSAALIEFFKGCETFVDGQIKKNIWCCRFDVSMAICGKGIDDNFKELEADDFGKILVANRKFNQVFDREESKNAVSRLDNYLDWANKLDDYKMKAYFTSTILKRKVRLLKKAHFGRSEDDKNCLIGCLEKALDECDSAFGVHWLTIDCHTQLGKLYWAFHNRDDAIVSFDNAICLAKSLSVSGNRRYLSCLVNKGRFLLDSGQKESIEEGKRLISKALDSCKDLVDEVMSLLAMKTLLQVDKEIREEMISDFFKEEDLDHRRLQIIHSAVSAELNSPDEDVNEENFISHEKVKVERLRQIIAHLEYLCQKSNQDENLRRTAISYLFTCTMWIGTKCIHVLSGAAKVELLSKALKLMETYEFIGKKKKKEFYFIINTDEEQHTLLKRKCSIIQKMRRMPKVDQEREVEILLKDCKKHRDVYFLVSKEFHRIKKEALEK